MAYIAHVVTCVWCGEVSICDALCVCVMFVSSRSVIVFNLIAGTITDHSQSAKDIDPYFKYQLQVKDPGHRKPVLILPNGLSKPWERAHDGNWISAMGGIRTHNVLIYSPACYHWAITALCLAFPLRFTVQVGFIIVLADSSTWFIILALFISSGQLSPDISDWYDM